nr:Xaa-Pro peptidase family protein [uncultured Niameybacter sp.]
MKTQRLNKLKTQFEALNIDGMLISNLTNVYYLSGFKGSNGRLLITKENQYLITDFRYIEQATKQAPDYEVVDQAQKGLLGTVMEIAEHNGIKNIGFESDYTNYTTFLEFGTYEDFKFVPTREVVENLRQTKDEEEIKNLREAERIGDLAFAKIIPFITMEYKNGLTETDIALELERIMRMNGASGVSFNSIVAAGAKSSLCHAVPGKETLKEGDFVVMDFGCVYNGYCSDMTRTIVIGEASDKHKEIYNIVLKAQLAALEAIKPGVKGKEIDAIARNIIAEAGYGDYFGHGLGHSVGLDIHENPRFSMVEERIIEEGMVLTVEPGIYVPGFGGVRIEDMIVVTKEGIENLTHSTKELIVIQ